MGVHLTIHYVNLGLIHETHSLDIIGRLRELDTGKCTGGDETVTVAGRCAPCNYLTLNLTDGLP